MIVHESHQVDPSVLSFEDEGEQIRLPQLIVADRSERLALSGCGNRLRAGQVDRLAAGAERYALIRGQQEAATQVGRAAANWLVRPSLVDQVLPFITTLA